MDPFFSVGSESLVHSLAEAGVDDVLPAVSSVGAHAVAAASPIRASMETTFQMLRMFGIIAHLIIARHRCDQPAPRQPP